MWKVLSQEIHMCNMKALSLLVRKLLPRLKFFKSRSNFKVKVTRSKIMVPCERYCHKVCICVQYESPISSDKVMAKVKVFQKLVKLQGQGHEVKYYGTMWKVLSQGIHMCNMKALSLLVRKVCPRLKFFKSRSNFKVKVTRSKIMVPCERSCYKEYTCAIWKPYHFS